MSINTVGFLYYPFITTFEVEQARQQHFADLDTAVGHLEELHTKEQAKHAYTIMERMRLENELATERKTSGDLRVQLASAQQYIMQLQDRILYPTRGAI